MTNQPPSLGTKDSAKGFKLKLYCIVEDDSNAFPVNILSNESIGDLKKAIKTAKKPDLDNIAADNLTLWKANIPIVKDTNYRKVVDDVKKDRNNKMGPADFVNKHIPKVLPKMIQIVVELPQRVRKRDQDEDDAGE
ncbi:hypothetical protein BGZ80_008061 [Entomortierella chlamydospora]|uniref:Crinkler effector protein N-terminal domain-containing protein n=1 Tax=Entomortierella chlamydospora TaxID=101097 RepID=A0A9P6SRD4_9FUNG|nr:hypothetical protein BGZ80_008061 [Entomortierella chlamydospora]